MVVEGKFEEVVIRALDGDRGAGEAHGKVFALLIPGEGIDDGDRFIQGAFFFFREFSGLEIVKLNFGQQGHFLICKSKKNTYFYGPICFWVVSSVG